MISELTRRETLLLGAAALASTIARPALAEEEPERHGMSAFGDLKYPAGFKHFEYVNPNAPKGGLFSQVGATRAFNQNFLTFNSLNIFILKGDGARRGRTRRAVRPRCARGANIARRAHLSFSAAARDQVPRWQPAHRPRRRLLAENSQGQGPPDRPATAARLRRRGGGR